MTMTMTMAVCMAMLMMVSMVVVVLGLWIDAVRQKVQDHQDASSPKTGHQPLRRKGGVIKMMEAEPDTGHFEIEELGIPECHGVFICRHTKIALVSKHLILGQALGV